MWNKTELGGMMELTGTFISLLGHCKDIGGTCSEADFLWHFICFGILLSFGLSLNCRVHTAIIACQSMKFPESKQSLVM